MLSRPEDSGGTRTIKLARGLAGSPAHTPPRSSRAYSSENSRSPGNIHNEKRSSHSGSQLLGQVGMIEFLQQDERPTFVIDLNDDLNPHANGLSLVFANGAFKAQPLLLESVAGKADDLALIFATSASYLDFKRWVLKNPTELGAIGNTISTFFYAGFLWKFSTIRERLRIFYGQPVPAASSTGSSKSRPSLQSFNGLATASPGAAAETLGYFETRSESRAEGFARSSTLRHASSTDTSEPLLETRHTLFQSSSPATNGDMSISELLTDSTSPGIQRRKFPENPYSLEASEMIQDENSIAEPGFFDWTRLPNTSALPSHIQFARSINWGATSLGPMHSWSPDLRGMCNLIMASPHPAAMYWGPEHVAIYNEAYIALAGKKHPMLMGRRYSDAWAEIWSAVEEVFSSALSSAQATMKDDDCKFAYPSFRS